MAFTYTLQDSDTTLTLTDGVAYNLLFNGFSAPTPRKRISEGGRSMFAHGSIPNKSVYENRVVAIRLQIYGSSMSDLKANVQAINVLLERGREFTETGLGSQLKLTRLWDGATNTETFHVLHGSLDISPAELSHLHVLSPAGNKILRDVPLVLVCEPFVFGTQETVENYVADPSFEVAGTPLADWNAALGGAFVDADERSTEEAEYGEAGLKFQLTGVSGSQEVTREQVISNVSAGEVWSFGVKVKITERTGTATTRCVMTFRDSSNNTLSSNFFSVQTSETGEFVLLSSLNDTAPASTDNIRLRIGASVSDTGTITLYFDGVMGVKAATLPTAFVSGRSIVNHNDDDGQAHINYIDIYPNQGDVYMPVQIKAAEQEAHDEHWDGARHAGRLGDDVYFEGEDGIANSVGGSTATYTTDDIADATKSAGNVRRSRVQNDGGGSNTIAAETHFRHDFDITTLPKGQFRVLALCGARAVSITLTAIDQDDFLFGMGWMYGGVELLDQTDPNESSFKSVPAAAFDTGNLADTPPSMAVLDLGIITVPPIKTPDGMMDATFILQIYEALAIAVDTGTSADNVVWYLDAVLLMPIDGGGDYVSKTSAQDVILLDSISTPKRLVIIDASDVVQSIPAGARSATPMIHPDGSRIYFLSQDSNIAAITDGWTIATTIQPLYLDVQDA